VLLKLLAGGRQDAWNIESILASVADRAELVTFVTNHIAELPVDAASPWRRILER